MNTIDPTKSPETPDVRGDAHETVPLETIDALVGRWALQQLDVVKLDIEEAEVDAVEGAFSALSRFRPTILLEAEDARSATQGRTKLDLERAMAQIGYELWGLNGRSGQLRRAEPPSGVEGRLLGG